MREAKTQSAILLLAMLAAASSTTVFSQNLSTPSAPTVELLEVVPAPVQSVDTPSTQPIAAPKTTSTDPRTRLLNSADRIGFGAAATGGTNYVYVKTFNELRTALQQDGNYVLLDPSLAGQQIVFSQTIYPGNNVTLDGSLAPGHSLVAGSSLPQYHIMLNNTGIGGQGNKIFHSIKLVGNRSQHGIEHGALQIFKGDNYWVDHVEITDFQDDAIGMGTSQPGSADYITVSNSKLHNTAKGLYGWYQDQINHGQGHITAFFNELAAFERNGMSRGAQHFHFFNNWVHSWTWQATESGGLGVTNFKHLAGNRTIDSNMLSQSNVYEVASHTKNQCAETADPAVGLAYGGWMYTDGQSIYNNGAKTCGAPRHLSQTSTSGPGAPNIPYSYTLMPPSEVKKHIQQNAGTLK